MQKILIVDDISTNRLLLKQMLMLMDNYTIIEAENGKEGIEKYQAEEPDLVLMDVNMPVMDGYLAATAIKSLSGDRHIPIIFITALSAEVSLKDSLESGGDDFISKPFNADVLESKIRAHLRIRDLTRQLHVKNEMLASHNQHLVNEQELIEHFFTNAIQQSYLDQHIIKYHMSSLSTFNGDILFVKNGPEGGLYVIMGDFSGHGLTAAMGTLPVALIFFKMVSESAPVSQIARELNRELYKLMPSSMFFAATLLELNAHGNVMSVWMGGVPESYCFSSSGELKETIHAQYMPLGILEDSEFDSATQIVTVEPGDKVYLYSDGVVEAKNTEGEIFGDQRLRQSLGSTNETRFEKVLEDLRLFTGRNEQEDDITLVELTCRVLPAEHDTQLATDITDTPVETLPWKMSVSLTEKEMCSLDPVKDLSAILDALPGLARHKDILHIVLSEMYANALEHSILELQSESKNTDENFVNYYTKRDELLKELKGALICFEFSFKTVQQDSFLHIKMMDNGRGFKPEQASSVGDEHLYGRGLSIINSLSDDVSFSEDGKIMNVIYRL